MHIPDGMLSTPVALVTSGGAFGFIAYAIHWIKRFLPERKVVLMATLGALIFALQMLNFPVAAGTSGHFSGGTMAAVTLGFWPASIVMTAVLGIQALFNDGGILAFGANVINLGIIGPGVGYGIYRLAIRIRDNRTARLVGAGIGAWTSTVISAAAVALEIGLSGNANLVVIGGAMTGWHAIIGIGEALITVALLSYLFAVRPDLITAGQQSNVATIPAGKSRLSTRTVLLSLGALAIILVGLSWLASGHPDGLEYVYYESGIGRAFHNPEWLSSLPIADYGIAGIANEQLSTILAGLVGLVLTGVLLWLVIASRFRKTLSSTDSIAKTSTTEDGVRP